jgi:hypothetical protein
LLSHGWDVYTGRRERHGFHQEMEGLERADVP